jgi:hypothetical protein
MVNMLVVGRAEGASEGTAGRVPQKQPLPQVWKKPQRGARAGGEGQLREQGMKSWAADEEEDRDGVRVGIVDAGAGRREGLGFEAAEPEPEPEGGEVEVGRLVGWGARVGI